MHSPVAEADAYKATHVSHVPGLCASSPVHQTIMDPLITLLEEHLLGKCNLDDDGREGDESANGGQLNVP